MKIARITAAVLFLLVFPGVAAALLSGAALRGEGLQVFTVVAGLSAAPVLIAAGLWRLTKRLHGGGDLSAAVAGAIPGLLLAGFFMVLPAALDGHLGLADYEWTPLAVLSIGLFVLCGAATGVGAKRIAYAAE